MDKSIAKHFKKENIQEETTWNTVGGTLKTSKAVTADFCFPEFYEHKTIKWKFHLTTLPDKYDMIIGRDLMKTLGISLDFNQESIIWDELHVPMKNLEESPLENFLIQDSKLVKQATNRIKNILDAKYEPANLNDVVNEATHLNQKEKDMLYMLLTKHKSLFDGSLGNWTGEDYQIELKDDVTPYHARPFPIPKIHEATLKMEVERLVKLGVLKKINRSTWAAPTFIIPKKDGSVRFISDFRELNKRIKRKPYPIPKIQDLMLKLEGFQYATSLDLNMGYYHIELSPDSRKLCTIVLPWGKYEYQRLPMGLCNSPDIFQEKMSQLVQDLEYVRAYIDDLLIITKGDWYDHLSKTDKVLQRLHKAGLKVNAKKSFFGRPELEYLGYWITRKGIQPVAKKVQAIQNLQPPKTKKQLRSFIGMVNYYRDMWAKRSEILAPLSALTSNKATWKWTHIEQAAFDTMKKVMSKETLLIYPDFNKTFEIHTDASHTQLGACISQEGQPIAFYSRKLNPAQSNYTTTERELLAIVETLKEFKNILLGHKIKVYTDHMNLTYKNFNTERVIRWRLILEEFGPELIYIKGEHNLVADALSRLEMTPQSLHMAEAFGIDTLPDDAYPLRFTNIIKHQQQDKKLLQLLESHKSYHLHTYKSENKKRTLICYKGKIVLPPTLQKRAVTWYHTQLCHPGETRTEQTIRQHYWWNTLRADVHHICHTCAICQTCKKTSTKYGLLPPKEAESDPWEYLCVDLIGPYTIKQKTINKQTKKPQELQLWCVTMIDPATSLFEMTQIIDKSAITVANIVETTWLTRYPWPSMLIYDRGKEFLGEFAQMISNDYGIKRKGITTRNPQANAIIERIHQTLGNIVRTFELQDLSDNNPWQGILAAAMFALRSTFHTTLQATPAQLVFGRDAILNTTFDANWHLIKHNKQKRINSNNQKENKSRIPHMYAPGDQVLYKNQHHKSKFGVNPWIGPYVIHKVYDNGAVQLQMGAITNTVNIRNI